MSQLQGKNNNYYPLFCFHYLVKAKNLQIYLESPVQIASPNLSLKLVSALYYPNPTQEGGGEIR